MKNSLPAILVILTFISFFLGMRKEKMFIVSSYSANNKPDVRMMEFGTAGEPKVLSEASLGNNPSYFTMAPDRTFYFVNEVQSFAGREGGGITIMRKKKRELQHLIGSSINQGGGGPCYVTLSHDKGYLLTANYGSGSVSVVKLNNYREPEAITDTLFFENSDPVASHPHMILYNRKKQAYYVTDLGLDRVFVFGFNSSEGKLTSGSTPYFTVEKGSGPRHMVMDRGCRSLFIVNELNSTVSAYDIRNETPVLKQTLSALPAGFSDENYSGDICLAPSGKYLYVTNRGSNTIGIFRVKNGKLTLKGHVSCGGIWPRNMAINKSGKRLIICNQRSGDLAFFRLNRRTGMPIKEDYSYKLNTPSCVKFIE